LEKPDKIGERIREFGLSKFSSLKAFSEALGIAQSMLSNYLAGVRRPGNGMQSRLRDLGCDIEWLMTGKKGGRPTAVKRQAYREPLYELNATGPLTPEQKKKLTRLAKRLRKLSPTQLDKIDELLRVFLKDFK
jgi:transcriptional regulator with XRE-family HTH domain